MQDYKQDILDALKSGTPQHVDNLRMVSYKKHLENHSTKAFMMALDELKADDVIKGDCDYFMLNPEAVEKKVERIVFAEFGELNVSALRSQRDSLLKCLEAFPLPESMEGLVTVCGTVLDYYEKEPQG